MSLTGRARDIGYEHILGDRLLLRLCVKANRDRERLVQLRRRGRVQRRDLEYELRHPEVAGPFVRDIEARAGFAVAPRPTNLALRAKKKPKAKRR